MDKIVNWILTKLIQIFMNRVQRIPASSTAARSDQTINTTIQLTQINIHRD